MKLKNTHELRRLATSPFLEEIHHLCWIDPFDNSGEFDAGWSCRDHAWLVALVARVLGYQSAIVHGETMFQAAAQSAGPIVNIHQQTHTWVAIERLGFIDLSVKRDGGAPEIFKGALPLRPVLFSEFVPRTAGRVVITRDKEEFTKAVRRCLPPEEKRVAIYFPTIRDTLLRQIIRDVFQWVNSPLTDRLREKHPAEVYSAAVLHLLGILEGSRGSLRSLSSDDAWAAIADESNHAAAKLIELAGL